MHEHHLLNIYLMYQYTILQQMFSMHTYTDYKVFLSAFAFSKPVFFLCLNCSNQALVNEIPLTVLQLRFVNLGIDTVGPPGQQGLEAHLTALPIPA